jgi:hypothetical protein
MSDLTLRLLVLVAAIIQIIFPWLVNPFRGGEQPLRSNLPSQIEPAGYAFAIWGPIYLAALVYAAWQLTPAGRSDAVTARVAPLAIVLYLGSSLWLAAAKYGPLWATMPILGVMALCAGLALVLVTRGDSQSLQRTLCLVAPFGLYAGWTLCAAFVNIAEVAPSYGFGRFGLTAAGYALLSIATLTALVAALLWLTRGNAVLAATVLWALVAIIVSGVQRGADKQVVVAAGLALLAVVAVTAATRTWARAASA